MLHLTVEVKIALSLKRRAHKSCCELIFFCLNTKENKQRKSQGKPERSARFALPSPHIPIRK